MKKILKFIGLILLAVVLYIGYLVMNPVSPLETVTFENDEVTFEVEYSRPFKKDRLIFGNKSDGALVPFDEYWRTGAALGQSSHCRYPSLSPRAPSVLQTPYA